MSQVRRRSLGIAGCLLASMAFAVGTTWAFAPVNVSSLSQSVDVIDPTFDVDVNLKDHVNNMPADGVYRRVDNIAVIAHDPNYSYGVTQLSVVLNGAQLIATCGSWDYRLGNGLDVEIGVGFGFPGDSQNHDTGRDLMLKIDSAGTTPTCRVTGGVVQATFIVSGS